MQRWSFHRAAQVAAMIIGGLSLAASPGWANDGNGRGDSENHGNAGSKHASSRNNSAASTRSGTQASRSQVKSRVQHQHRIRSIYEYDFEDAAAEGKLNGFLHASPDALVNASPHSPIGKVSKVYAGLLQDYLSAAEGAPTPRDLARALADASGRPLTVGIIAAVHDKLFTSDMDLAASLAGSGKTTQDLTNEIATAL